MKKKECYRGITKIFQTNCCNMYRSYNKLKNVTSFMFVLSNVEKFTSILFPVFLLKDINPELLRTMLQLHTGFFRLKMLPIVIMKYLRNYFL